MGVPTNAEIAVTVTSSASVGVRLGILDTSPNRTLLDRQEDALIPGGLEQDPWSCPKDEQVPALRSLKSASLVTPNVSAAPPSAAQLARRPPQQQHSLATPECYLEAHQAPSRMQQQNIAEELREENEQLRIALEGRRAERRRQEEDTLRVQKRLQQLEFEVRSHWQDRVACLEAEVAELKSALADAGAANARAARWHSFSEPEADSPQPDGPRPSLPAGRLAEAWQPATARTNAAAATVAAPLRLRNGGGVGGSDSGSNALQPWWVNSVDFSAAPSAGSPAQPTEPPRTPVALLPHGCSSPQAPTPPSSSSPRAQRPPPTRPTWAEASRQVEVPWHVLQQGVPSTTFYTSMPRGVLRTSRSTLTSAGVTAPRTLGVKPRSRSLPTAQTTGEEDDSASAVGFFEAFGGFYKQLVRGPQCTGPDVLAVNECSHEIDLSGEFPPEKREAQVDLLILQPQLPHQPALVNNNSWERDIERDRLHDMVVASMHHL